MHILHFLLNICTPHFADKLDKSDIRKLGARGSGFYIRLFLFQSIRHIITLSKHIMTLLYHLIVLPFLPVDPGYYHHSSSLKWWTKVQVICIMGMAGIEPTLFKSNDWTPLLPYQALHHVTKAGNQLVYHLFHNNYVDCSYWYQLMLLCLLKIYYKTYF